MNTPLDSNSASSADTTTANGLQGRRRLSMRIVSGLAAAAVVAAVAVGVVAQRDDKDPATTQSLAVVGGGDGPIMNSCIPFSVDILADMPVAFSGTVTERTDTTATITVDRWYKASIAGETDLVTFALPAEGLVSFEGGVDLVAGQRYFITATEGNVNGCGYSGDATPELEASFNEAFPG